MASEEDQQEVGREGRLHCHFTADISHPREASSEPRGEKSCSESLRLASEALPPSSSPPPKAEVMPLRTGDITLPIAPDCEFEPLREPLHYTCPRHSVWTGVIPNSILRGKLGYDPSEVEIPPYKPPALRELEKEPAESTTSTSSSSCVELTASAVDRDPSRAGTVSKGELEKEPGSEGGDDPDQSLVTCISGLLEDGASVIGGLQGGEKGKEDSTPSSPPDRQHEQGDGRTVSEGLTEEKRPSAISLSGGPSRTRNERKAKTKMAAGFGPIKEEQAPTLEG